MVGFFSGIKDNRFLDLFNPEFTKSLWAICRHKPHIVLLYRAAHIKIPMVPGTDYSNTMSQHLYEQLLVKRGKLNHVWEEFLAEQYRVEDLDLDEIHKTIKQGIASQRIPDDALGEDAKDTLSRLKLLDNGKLKNAAVVLFAKELSKGFGQCRIQMARFKGISKSDDFEDNQQTYGNAFKILAEANAFMKRHLNIASFYQADSFVRIDKPTLPVLAVREALINAICHRNYQSTAAISVAIFDDRLEIWNTGALPKELKVQDLKTTHGSYPRNELIAETFYKRGLIEKWGTGIVKMVERCREHGLSDPRFEEYSGGLSVTFMFAEPIGPRVGGVNKKQPSVELKQESENLSKRQREILEILEKTGELKATDIMEQLLDPPAKRTLKKDLFELKKIGLINFRGQARATTWFLVKDS